jgi:hypothetical protein
VKRFAIRELFGLKLIGRYSLAEVIPVLADWLAAAAGCRRGYQHLKRERKKYLKGTVL